MSRSGPPDAHHQGKQRQSGEKRHGDDPITDVAVAGLCIGEDRFAENVNSIAGDAPLCLIGSGLREDVLF